MFDNKMFSISNHSITLVDKDEILFSETLNKIMILNSTASFIWNVLCDNENDGIIVYDIIQKQIIDKFDVSSVDELVLQKDIDKVIQTFINEGFLCLVEED